MKDFREDPEYLDQLTLVARLKNELRIAIIEKNNAERKYLELCEKLVKVHIYAGEIDTITMSTTINVQVSAPTALDTEEFRRGVIAGLVDKLSVRWEHEKLVREYVPTSKPKEK